MPCGNPLAVPARKGRIVYREGHLHGGFGYLYELVGFYGFGRADSVADVYFVETREADDVARLGLVAVDAVETLDLIEVDNFARLPQRLVIVVGDDDRLPRLYRAALYAADAYAADVVVVVDGRAENLRRAIGIYLHGLNVV